MTTQFRTADFGSFSNPCQTYIQCTRCRYNDIIAADDFADLEDRIQAAIHDHVTEAHMEPDESPDELRRQLDEARAAYADLERMYHRVAREHLVTALRLHKARALIRRLRRRGITLPALTVTPTPGNFGVNIDPGPGPAAGASMQMHVAHNPGEQPTAFLRMDEALPDPGILQHALELGYRFRRRGML